MAKTSKSPANIKQIKQAITDADKRTGCEIAVVISDSSGRYDRAEDVFGVVLAILILVAAWFAMPYLQTPQDVYGGWTDASASPLGLLAIVAIIVGGFILGAVLATWFPILKTLFIARQEMSDEVARAAQSCFYETGLRNARHGAGILIYVSKYERMVQIIGDDATSAYLKETDWDEIRDSLVTKLKQRDETGGFIDAIALISDKLDGVFLAK